MSKRYFLSRKGLDALHFQQSNLIDDLSESTRAMGRSASLDNDLRENPEFMQLRTRVTYEIPVKLAEIQAILNTHILIEKTEAVRANIFDEVLPGMDVEIESQEGETRKFSIMGYGEGNPTHGVISYLSPVGAALLYKEVGDEVYLPNKGKRVIYEIVKITRSVWLD